MGIVDPREKAAQSDAEGRAVGGACRQSGRAIEDRYSIYLAAQVFHLRGLARYGCVHARQQAGNGRTAAATGRAANDSEEESRNDKEDVAANESKATPDTKATTAQH